MLRLAHARVVHDAYLSECALVATQTPVAIRNQATRSIALPPPAVAQLLVQVSHVLLQLVLGGVGVSDAYEHRNVATLPFL